MRRTVATFASLFLLWAIVAEVNHALTGVQLYLWIGGLFVTYAALALPLRSGLAASLLGGLLLDAAAPIAFGTHALLFAAAHAFIFNLRDRLPRDETTARVVVALFANLALFLVFSFLHIGRVPTPALVWPRLVADLVVSQLFLTLIAPWFFALQARLLAAADQLAARYERRFQ